MYPLQIGQEFGVQAFVNGGGLLDGATPLPLAAHTFGASNSAVTVRARRFGAAANAFQVRLADIGLGLTQETTLIRQTNALIEVFLRRVPGTPLPIATAAEVAAAINAAAATDYGFPIVADYGGNGTGIVAPAAGATLTGGVDPELSRTTYKWRRTANTGLFYFENETESVLARTIQVNALSIADNAKLKVEVVNLSPGLTALDERFPVRDFTLVEADGVYDYGILDIATPILPGQALAVTLTDIGSSLHLPANVSLVMRRAPRFPY